VPLRRVAGGGGSVAGEGERGHDGEGRQATRRRRGTTADMAPRGQDSWT
jgi:hypothetical protein